MIRAYVGMSGGVDSSVTAALLVEQGYDVTGVYMKNWSQDLPGMKCPWAEDLADAKRVAVQLGIDFKVYDFEAEYKHKVVDYMIAEYEAGRTPNPDIMCNQEVKFKLFLETALEDGADMIATGHYARVEHRFSPTKFSDTASRPLSLDPPSGDNGAADASENLSANARLLQAVDTNKDQTYFLYRVTADALEKTLFPLGDYTKTEVRELAKARGLWTATKKESMGVCFVGSVGMREFLSQYVTTRPGDIIDRQNGKLIGRHDGAIFYTLGQRHGLDVGGGLPYYVVGKDMQKNEVYVSTNLNDTEMWRSEVTLRDVHWIGESLDDGAECQVRLRHRGPLVSAKLGYKETEITLTLSEPQRAVTPGQSAVIYRASICCGGGIIV